MSRRTINQLTEAVWEKKIAFFGVFFVIFSLSYLALVAIDFVPEPKEVENTPVPEEIIVPPTRIEQAATLSEAVDSAEPVLPRSIYIPKLDREVMVLNPASRTVADLDTALLSGVVRHPDSAHLGQTGNVFILGHSSYLPTVLNRNFQAFNGIEDLEWGDTIEVTTDDGVVIYEVQNTYKARAQDVTVPIAGDEKLLTLATCNSFGSTDDRFIVEAKKIGTKTL
jgi:LPXTG-site transpeptidase (sortase) family protein